MNEKISTPEADTRSSNSFFSVEITPRSRGRSVPPHPSHNELAPPLHYSSGVLLGLNPICQFVYKRICPSLERERKNCKKDVKKKKNLTR